MRNVLPRKEYETGSRYTRQGNAAKSVSGTVAQSGGTRVKDILFNVIVVVVRIELSVCLSKQRTIEILFLLKFSASLVTT